MSIRIVLTIMLCWSVKGFGQQDLGIGILPNWDYGIKLNSKWKINGKIEGRFNAFTNNGTDQLSSNWGFQLVDFQTGFSYKTRPNQSINFSFLLRYEESEFFYRSIQQFTVAKSYSSFHLGQRFRLDQMVGANAFWEVRARYRLTFITALSGHQIDDNEPYFKLNNEYIGELEEGVYSAEVRIIPSIGYAFNDHNKLEVGIDYRLGDLFTSQIEHNFWLNIGWYYTFKKSNDRSGP